MTATLTASGRDLRTLAGIVSEDRGEPPAHGLAPSLLDDLLGLIRCDFLSFVGMDTGQQADLVRAGGAPRTRRRLGGDRGGHRAVLEALLGQPLLQLSLTRPVTCAAS